MIIVDYLYHTRLERYTTFDHKEAHNRNKVFRNSRQVENLTSLRQVLVRGIAVLGFTTVLGFTRSPETSLSSKREGETGTPRVSSW
jgi:hypothetical protein